MIFAHRQKVPADERRSANNVLDTPESADRNTTCHPVLERTAIERAVGLLSQQIWCWGQDILRAEGNWLLNIGFTRQGPPVDRQNCTSIYALDLARGRRVTLRGFGVFYGVQAQGGVFLPRYEFRPKYTTHARLDCPPWTDSDLPKLKPPSDAQRNACVTLTLELIDWIRAYEVSIIEHLGIEYRRQTLRQWNNGKRPFTPAEQFASAWRRLSLQLAANFDAFTTGDSPEESGDVRPV